MSGLTNRTPQDSQISCSSDWNLPLNDEEHAFVQQHPVVKDTVDVMSKIVTLLTLPATLINCQLLDAEISKFLSRPDKQVETYYVHLELFRADFMFRRSFPLLAQNYTKDCLPLLEGNTLLGNLAKVNSVKEICQPMFDLIMELTDTSDNLRREMCHSGFVPYLLSEVRLVTDQVVATGEFSQSFFSVIVIIYNCSRNTESAAVMRQSGALSILRPLRQIDSSKLKWLLLPSMCNIAKDDDSTYVVADANSLKRGIDLLKSGIISNNDHCMAEEGLYTIGELPENLETIVKRPENWGLSLSCGLLPVITLLLEVTTDDFKIIACRMVKNFSRSEDILAEIRKTDAEKQLVNLCRSEDRRLKEAAEQALEVVRLA